MFRLYRGYFESLKTFVQILKLPVETLGYRGFTDHGRENTIRWLGFGLKTYKYKVAQVKRIKKRSLREVKS